MGVAEEERNDESGSSFFFLKKKKKLEAEERTSEKKTTKLTPALEDLVELGLVEQLRVPRAPPFLLKR